MVQKRKEERERERERENKETVLNFDNTFFVCFAYFLCSIF